MSIRSPFPLYGITDYCHNNQIDEQSQPRYNAMENKLKELLDNTKPEEKITDISIKLRKMGITPTKCIMNEYKKTNSLKLFSLLSYVLKKKTYKLHFDCDNEDLITFLSVYLSATRKENTFEDMPCMTLDPITFIVDNDMKIVQCQGDSIQLDFAFESKKIKNKCLDTLESVIGNIVGHDPVQSHCRIIGGKVTFIFQFPGNVDIDNLEDVITFDKQTGSNFDYNQIMNAPKYLSGNRVKKCIILLIALVVCLIFVLIVSFYKIFSHDE